MHSRLQKGGLSMEIQNRIRKFIGIKENEVNIQAPKDKAPRRCRICIEDSHGDGHKSKKNTLSKVSTRCELPTCKKHSVMICEGCSKLSAKEMMECLNYIFKHFVYIFYC